jgi:hypothetical protein
MAEKNPIIEANRRAMEFIWQKVPKTLKDGKEFVTYAKTDLPYLYNSGLVDTNRFTFKQWEQAFADSLGEDGKYWVTHKKMLFLGFFRYSKTVGEPFDPLRLRTGKWPIERLWRVYENSVIPSCSLPSEFIKQKFDQIFRKKQSPKEALAEEIKGAEKEGQEALDRVEKNIHLVFEGGPEGEMVVIEKEHLVNLKNFLDTYPSPRRKLEMAVQEMKMGKLQTMAGLASAKEKSTFELGKDFRETTKKDLKDMLVKASENRTAGRKTTGEEINVKDMHKKRPRPTKF